MILAWIRIKIHLAQKIFWLIDAMGETAGGGVRIKELSPNVFLFRLGPRTQVKKTIARILFNPMMGLQIKHSEWPATSAPCRDEVTTSMRGQAISCRLAVG